VRLFLALPQGEVVAGFFAEEGVLCDTSTRHGVRDPEITGGSSIEVKGVFDIEAFQGLGSEVVGKALKSCGVGVGDAEVVRAIPNDE
jgi:hypothetical protein